MKSLLLLAVLASGCRGDGHAPGASQGPGSATQIVPVRDGEPGSPPGTDALVAVPSEVARGIKLEEVAHGLNRPVLLTVAPGDPRRRWFIVEQRGAIRVIENGKLASKPFFTIQGLADGNEQGLLGLAFHPQFATNGRLYVNYTTSDMATHIVEYKTVRDPDSIDVATKRELAVIEQPYSNHNGGNLEFGPDGKLYVGMGDGGAANDPHGNGQNSKALLGKLLRFDVEAAKPVPEIVHIGLRNPWRFAFDGKDLYIGDVGQNLWEYVHVVSGSDTQTKNFGWNIVEGSHCFDPETGAGKASCDKTGLTLPVAEYSHEQGCSITGGRVYRGKALPALVGRYFYADYCTGLLRSFVWTAGHVREHWDWKPAIDTQGELTQISSFGVDHDGELYIVELTGSIYRLSPAT